MAGNPSIRLRAHTSDLRTRYFPKSRIGHGLVSVAPWANVLLLMFLYVLMAQRFVIQPGLVVSLPKGPFMQGTPPGLTALIVPVAGDSIVFFDDLRYNLADERQVGVLKAAFAEQVNVRPDTPLVIEADEQVPHGTVVRMMNLALEAGFRKVNIAEKPGE